MTRSIETRSGFISALDRLMSKVEFDTAGGCWLFNRFTDHDGYGMFHAGRECRAHRAAYALMIGEIPRGLLVRHKCDVRACVNPDHLTLGTHADNMADMKARKRQSRKAAPVTPNRSNRLGPDKAKAVYQASGSSYEIARLFGVTPSMVRRIRRNEAWADITASLTRGELRHVPGLMEQNA